MRERGIEQQSVFFRRLAGPGWSEDWDRPPSVEFKLIEQL
jgi:hypothetical protein